LLQYFRSSTRKNAVVLAPTGVAAVNIKGQTIHSFFRFKPDITPEKTASIRLSSKQKSLYKKIDTLVIDEISMLPGHTLAFVEALCREVTGDLRPFGGIQILAVGDFLQLPPVAPDGRYDWAFAAPAWEAAGFCPVTLRQVHRQDEPVFVEILNQFRDGVVTRESAAVLRRRVARFPDSTILRLFTHNAQVDRWNNYQLECIEAPEAVYQATMTGPDHECDFLRRNLVTPEVLRLRPGARVMVTACEVASSATL
jgi:hypothetical protein